MTNKEGPDVFWDFVDKYGGNSMQCAAGVGLYCWYVTGESVTGNGNNYVKGGGSLDRFVPAQGNWVPVSHWYDKLKVGDIAGWIDSYNRFDAYGPNPVAQGLPDGENKLKWGHVAMWNGNAWDGFNQGGNGNGTPMGFTISPGGEGSIFRFKKVGGSVGGLAKLVTEKGLIQEVKY